MATITGSNGNDFLTGTAGSDTINSGNGDDTVNGGAGSDSLNGGAGADTLDGDSGNDQLNGGSGNDTLIYNVTENSAPGTKDVYTGGSGIDMLVIEFTRTQWLESSTQTQIANYLAHLAAVTNANTGEVSNASGSDFVFTFGSSTLTVQMTEALRIFVDGVAQNPVDHAVRANNDVGTVGEDGPGVNIYVLQNDSVPDLVKQLALESPPGHGTATLTQPDSNNPATWYFEYQPNQAYFQYLGAGQTATDTFTYRVTDADGDSGVATVTVTITGTNDAPVLNAAVAPTLASVAEDAVAPSGAVGTLVSSLVDFNPPATGLNNVSDADSGAVTGIAITGTNSANGTWWYSTNGGVAWTAVGAVSGTSALLLAADANTRVYFQGNSNFSGTVSDGITFRAWDQTSGTAGTKVSTSTNGGTTAFSTATDTAAIAVSAVNDAPTTTPVALAAIAEDSGARVITQAQLLANASDVENDALVASNLAISAGSGTLVNNNDGSWSYTPASNDDTAVSFSYTITDNGTTNGVADPKAVAGSATLDITTVNDAPVLNAAATPVLSSVAEDAGVPVGSVGTRVSELVNLNPRSGGLDNVTDADSGAVTGIAITGTNSANGTWWYSTNGGGAWTQVGAVADSSALLLAADATTRVYFQGNSNFSGMVSDGVTFRAWDQTSGTAGTKVSTSTNGGSTAFSNATDVAAITVTAVNDAPVAVADTVITNVALGTSYIIPGEALLANDTDVDSSASQFSIASVSNPATLDSVSLSGGDVTYTDNVLAGGSFNYTVSDGTNTSAPGNVSITRQASATFAGTQANEIFIGSSGNNEIYQFDASAAGGFGRDTIRDMGGNGEEIQIITSAPLNSTSIASLNFERVGDDLIVSVNASQITVYDQYVSGNALSTIKFTNGGTAYGYQLNTTGYGLSMDTSSPLDGTNQQDMIAGTSSLTGEVLNGQNQNDLLFGNAGNDTLNGGTGNDLLVGGGGNDTFVFDTTLNASSNVDRIADLQADGTDKIHLDESIFSAFATPPAGGTQLAAANFAANAGGVAGDSSDFILYDTNTGSLYYDADGNGAGAKVLFATLHLPGVTGTVDNTDFIIIP